MLDVHELGRANRERTAATVHASPFEKTKFSDAYKRTRDLRLRHKFGVAVLWLLLTPPNPEHTSCVASSHLLEGTNVRVGQHIAFGTFMNWQLWGTHADQLACEAGIATLHKEAGKMPQQAGSENYTCFVQVISQATCISADDPRVKEK